MKKNNQNGYSLIELMISIAISGIITASLFSFFIFNQRVFETQNQITDMQQNARAALNFITETIMNAGYDPKGIGFDPIDPSSNKTYIKIYADINENGKLPPEDLGQEINETVVFSLDKKKQIIRNWNNQPFINNITGLEFQYIPPLPGTEHIIISLTAKTEQKVKGKFKTLTLTSEVFLKNRL